MAPDEGTCRVGASQLDELMREAQRVMAAPRYEFRDLARVMRGFDRDRAAAFVNELLATLLGASGDDESRFFREVDLCGDGDFNLTIVQAGGGEARKQIAASEFDMLVTNLAPVPVSIPVYRTDIDPSEIERRPGRLATDEVEIAPYETASFDAFGDIADVGGASPTGPLLIVHSMPRGVMTWVFDRTTLEPVNLTTTHLQVSRVQLAVRVMSELGGGTEDVDRLAALASSEYIHFVRWEAAKAVYALDAERGLELLEDDLSDDPHQAIRAAARASLDEMTQAVS